MSKALVRTTSEVDRTDSEGGDRRRVALVTGGSRGIGAAIAVRLAHDGFDVAMSFKSSEVRATRTVDAIAAAGARGLAIRADSANRDEVVALVNRVATAFGRLDVLVNSAGVSVQAPLDEIGAAAVEETLAVNVRAPFVASQAASTHLKPGGRIISIGSNVVERTPFAGMTLYAMSKSALVGMTKGLARDLGERDITANVVSPGPIVTDMNPADGPHAAAASALTARGRYGTVADVAGTVSWLASAASANVTGANILVDGGISA